MEHIHIWRIYKKVMFLTLNKACFPCCMTWCFWKALPDAAVGYRTTIRLKSCYGTVSLASVSFIYVELNQCAWNFFCLLFLPSLPVRIRRVFLMQNFFFQWWNSNAFAVKVRVPPPPGGICSTYACSMISDDTPNLWHQSKKLPSFLGIQNIFNA